MIKEINDIQVIMEDGRIFNFAKYYNGCDFLNYVNDKIIIKILGPGDFYEKCFEFYVIVESAMVMTVIIVVILIIIALFIIVGMFLLINTLIVISQIINFIMLMIYILLSIPILCVIISIYILDFVYKKIKIGWKKFKEWVWKRFR